MNLQHLHYVVASARNGSFSAAAHELNVRQPIVSKRIREVEGELGVSLFERSTTGARLTTTGERFVVSAQRIVDEMERLAEHAKASACGRAGSVVVGFYKSLSSGAFPNAIQRFRQQYPEIALELIEAPLAELNAGIHAGAIDTAIILGDVGKCEVLNASALWSEHLMAVLPANHPLADRAVLYWPDLKCERFLISEQDPGPDIRAILFRHLAAPSDHPEVLTLRLSRESILTEVAKGQGITLLCESAAGLAGLGVVFRNLHNGDGATRLGYIACWKPGNSNPALQSLLDVLQPGT